MAKFIIISGAPGAGKTTLANSLSIKFQIPVFSKDFFKCLLADQIPGEGVEYTQSLGRSSIEILKSIMNELIKSDSSYILESAFIKVFDDEFFKNIKKNSLLQIFCRIDPETSLIRIKNRLESGERHACHLDHLRINDIEQSILNGAYNKLNIENTLEVEINESFSNDQLYESIQRFLV